LEGGREEGREGGRVGGWMGNEEMRTRSEKGCLLMSDFIFRLLSSSLSRISLS